jgi:type I restriction enzyme S subunit
MKTYDLYKDSCIEWIGEIPRAWKISRFNHNFSFSRGLPITKQDLKDNGVPCVSYGEIHSKFGRIIDPEKHQLKFADESFLESNPNSLLSRGDFLFADTSEDLEGSGNFTCLDSDSPTFAGYHTVIARLLNRQEFDYKYLSYFFDSIEFRNQIRSSVTGIKVFSITQGILKSTSIVVPRLQEQSSISSYLDRKTAEIDELINDKKRLLQLYEEEKTSVINQAVTKGINPDAPIKDSGIECLGVIPEHWEVKRLKYVGKIKYGLGQPPKQKIDGLPIIRATNVFRGRIDEKDLVFVDPDDIPYERDPILRTNDIIVVRSGAYTADSAIIPSKYDGAVTGYDMVFRSNENIFPKFVAFGLLSDYILKRQLIMHSLRAAQPHLNREELGETIIAVPSFEEQQTIVQNIENECSLIEEKKAKTQKLIDLLTEYRTALISEVVTGKVKVID